MPPAFSPQPDPVATSDDAPPTKRGDSAASMATEILSAAPRTPVAEPTEKTGPTMLAEDVTIMAKGRRRRFRLR
jgi:hypothetical protein